MGKDAGHEEADDGRLVYRSQLLARQFETRPAYCICAARTPGKRSPRGETRIVQQTRPRFSLLLGLARKNLRKERHAHLDRGIPDIGIVKPLCRRSVGRRGPDGLYGVTSFFRVVQARGNSDDTTVGRELGDSTRPRRGLVEEEEEQGMAEVAGCKGLFYAFGRKSRLTASEQCRIADERNEGRKAPFVDELVGGSAGDEVERDIGDIGGRGDLGWRLRCQLVRPRVGDGSQLRTFGCARLDEPRHRNTARAEHSRDWLRQ